MRPSALVSLLVVLCTSFIQIDAESMRRRGSQRQKRRAQERTTFQSFFNVIYLANQFGETDLITAADTLAYSYNGKFLPRYSNDEAYVQVDYYDPYERRMELVEVVEVESRRVLSEEEIRKLQSSSQLRNLNVFLRVTGSCLGCPQRTRFTNQASSRRRRRVNSKNGKGGKGGKGGDVEIPIAASTPPPTPPPTIETVVRDDTITSPVPIQTEAPIQTPAPVQTAPPTSAPIATAAPIQYVDPAELPSEAQLLAVYAQEIRNRNLNILDVLSLDEIDN